MGKALSDRVSRLGFRDRASVWRDEGQGRLTRSLEGLRLSVKTRRWGLTVMDATGLGSE